MGAIKKILIILPVLVVSCIFLRMHYFKQYERASHTRLLALLLTVLLFYAWVAIGVIRRTQNTIFDMLVQSSFYVYVFSVLTLTGYFIFFNQVSAHNWWHKIQERIDTMYGINLRPFVFMKGHRLLSYEVIGNLIMLLPLGIYLPLLYKRINGFFSVTLVAMMVSVSIELMQLATNTRITDVDDVILNTAGASMGFVIYFAIYTFVIKPMHVSGRVQAYSSF